jgi:hypothetical protein
MTLPIIPPEPGSGSSGKMKLCCIKLNVKFPVQAFFNPSTNEPTGWFYPVGEEKETKIGDVWGSKGQGGKDQELDLEVVGVTTEEMMLDFKTGMTPITVDTKSTTLDPYSDKIQNIEVELSVCFVCCTCLLADGTGKLQNADDCCKLENFTSPGGGHKSGLGMWRTGYDPDNKECRTPTYSVPISIGPPGDELKELKDEMHKLFRSDVMMNLARSYAQICCWSEDEGSPVLGPN